MISILALLDDVAALADDTAAMAKLSFKKTASILGDDIAVNAEQSSKFSSKRELIAIFKIVKGAIINKMILLPIIFGLSLIFPVAITILLVLGAIYLAFEGIEALIENLGFHSVEDEEVETESQKIKGAIKTDFVLSIEIIVIAFSTVMNAPLSEQIIVVSVVALIATVFVYGLVALVVRLDDIGFWLINKGYKKIGYGFVKSLQIIINALKWIGMIAMFLVAGGIIIHKSHLHEMLEPYHFDWFVTLPIEFGIGVVLGLTTLIIYKAITKLYSIVKG